jgi:hypothetical protein
MEKDWLEKIIFESKDKQNIHKAPPSLWDQIEKELDKKQKTNIISISWFRIAAIFLGVLVSGIFIGKIYFSQKLNPMMAQDINIIDRNEAYFTPRVDFKIKEAKANNIYDSKLEQHIASMDQVYNDLKNEYLNNPQANKEKLIDEMFKINELKIVMIDRLLKFHKTPENFKNIKDQQETF